MARRFLRFDLKAVAVLIIVAVAVFTSVWLTKQTKPASRPAASELRSATIPSEQLKELRTALPQVTTRSKQETPMAFTAKKKKDPFVPDWPVKPKEDKRDAKVSIEIARVEAETGEREYPDLHELPKEPYEVPEKPYEPSHTAPLPLADEDSVKGMDEEPDLSMGHIAAGNGEDAKFEDELSKTEDSPKEAAEALMDEACASEISSSESPALETDTAIEEQPDGDAAGNDEPRKQELKPAVEPPRLFVTGIIVSGDASYAIIATPTSSVIVQPGDEVGGVTVKSVEAKAVVVVKQDEEFVLELGGGGESR